MFTLVSTSDINRASKNTHVQTEPTELGCDSVRRKKFRDTVVSYSWVQLIQLVTLTNVINTESGINAEFYM